MMMSIPYSRRVCPGGGGVGAVGARYVLMRFQKNADLKKLQ